MLPQIPGGFTAMPNYFLDEQLGKVSPASFAVLAYICRRTLGFNQLSAKIPLNQFQNGFKASDGTQMDSGAGLTNRRTLIAALKELKERGLIDFTTTRGQDTVYTVILPASSDLPLSEKKASGKSATSQVAKVPLAKKNFVPSGTAKHFSRKKELEKKKEGVSTPIDFSKFEPGGKYHKLVNN